MQWTFEATSAGYGNLWKSARLKDEDRSKAELYASRIIAAEAQYSAVQAATGVPWFFIGALHMRESSCNFAGVLHNGEHIIGTGRVTSLVPAGRGPFSTWAEAAIDALKLKNLHRVQHWSIERMLYEAEVFNGLGYVGKGINSPYVWAGTTHEQRGKYVADHQFNPNAEDTQIGVAAVLIRLAEKRPDIHAILYPEKEKQPMDESDLLKEIQGLRSDMAALPAAIVSALKGTAPVSGTGGVSGGGGAVLVTPTPAPAAPPATPILDRPGVGLGVLGTLLSGVLSIFGVTGPVTGEAATTTGQLLPLVSAGVAALGATGMFGTWGSAISTVLSALTQSKQQPK